MVGLGWTTAKELLVGQQLVTSDGDLVTVAATRAEAHPETITVYNLTVEGDHTYFVTEASGNEAVWVHNVDAPQVTPVGGKINPSGPGGKQAVAQAQSCASCHSAPVITPFIRPEPYFRPSTQICHEPPEFGSDWSELGEKIGPPLTMTGMVGVSFVPLAGEVMDLYVLKDPTEPLLSKGIAAVSLGINLFTGTFAPNYGGLRAGARLAFAEVEAGAQASRAQMRATLSSGRAAAQTATKAVNLPSWRKVLIDMEHVISGHTPRGGRVLADTAKSLFPAEWTREQIEAAIREAYRYGKRIRSQEGRVLIEGVGRGRNIRMWLNTTTQTIETAYPF